jgi:hypothetical protein
MVARLTAFGAVSLSERNTISLSVSGRREDLIHHRVAE